jgi:Fur family ferric uptake transcriptional regulator/Fur family peroxide stress response transcriptional regulator
VNLVAEEKQKRMTKQKRVVYEVLASTKSHPTADWIYQQARREVPDISLGTIYRNLQVLLVEHRICELNYGKGQSRFDANPRPHYHFVCEHCGQVIDFPDGAQPVQPQLLAQAPGIVHSYRLECYGTCYECQKSAEIAKQQMRQLI